MPALLLTLLPYLKKALPYIAGIMLVLGAYWWADSRGRAAQLAKDQPTITALTSQRDSWRTAFNASDANFNAAMSAIAIQNADTQARANAFNASKVADAKNIAAANAAWEKSETSRKALADIALNGKSGCKPSDALMNAIGDDL